MDSCCLIAVALSLNSDDFYPARKGKSKRRRDAVLGKSLRGAETRTFFGRNYIRGFSFGAKRCESLKHRHFRDFCKSGHIVIYSLTWDAVSAENQRV